MNDINNQHQGIKKSTLNSTQAQSASQKLDPNQHAQPKVEQTKQAITQGADQAKFTPTSQALLRMTQESKNINDIDQKKVDDIKQALEKGEFPINASRMAEKMTSLEKLLQG